MGTCRPVFRSVLLAGLLVVGASARPPQEVPHNQVTGEADPLPTVDGGSRSDVPLSPPLSLLGAKSAPATVELASFSSTVFGIPASALAAYRRAAEVNAASNPRCHLTWTVLAGIGKVESNHANGGDLDANGTARHPILGPVLDGTHGTAAIRDTDNGMYDHDAVWDRAVGPMQFIPSTWAVWGTDGSGNGKPDPENVHDATLSAAHYLCAHGRDLATSPGLRAAILSYKGSAEYLNVVLHWIAVYEGGAVAVPDGFAPPTPLTSSSTASTPPANQPSSPLANQPPEPAGPANGPHEPTPPAKQQAAPTKPSAEPAPQQQPAPSSLAPASTTPPNPVSQLLDGLARPLAGLVSPSRRPSEAHP